VFKDKFRNKSHTISSTSSNFRPLTSGRKKNTQTAVIKAEGNQIKPYRGPQFKDRGLIKYGAVNWVSHAKKNPMAAERPKV
jgi:hypothetical protein